MTGKVIGKVALKVFGLEKEAKVFRRGFSLLKELKSGGIGDFVNNYVESKWDDLVETAEANKAFAKALADDKFTRNAFVKMKATKAFVPTSAKKFYDDMKFNTMLNMGPVKNATSAARNMGEAYLKAQYSKLPPAQLIKIFTNQKSEADKPEKTPKTPKPKVPKTPKPKKPKAPKPVQPDDDETIYGNVPYRVFFSSSFVIWGLFEELPGNPEIGKITVKMSGKSSKAWGSIYRFPQVFPVKVFNEMIVASALGGSVGQTFWNRFFRRWRKVNGRSTKSVYDVKTWTSRKKI